MEVYNKSPLSCEICKSRLAPQEPQSRVQLGDIPWAPPRPSRTRAEIENWLSAKDLLSTFVVQFVNLLISCNFGLWSWFMAFKRLEQESKHTEGWVFMAPTKWGPRSGLDPPHGEMAPSSQTIAGSPTKATDLLISSDQNKIRSSTSHTPHWLLVKYWLLGASYFSLGVQDTGFLTALHSPGSQQLIPVCIIVTLR